MEPTALFLVLISTFLHAGWNLLARRLRSEGAFFGRMLLVTVTIGLVPAALSEWWTRSINQTAWLCVLGSGICGGLYFCFLARAYRSSDFTVVYPMARALPVLLVAMGDVLRGRLLTGAGWAGVALVMIGCFLTPLISVRDVSWRRYVNRASMWMLLTALGTVGYTLLDKVASEQVTAGPATAARYGYFYFAIAWFVFFISGGARGGATESPGRIGWRGPILAAMLTFGAYWLVLWAYQLTERAGYVVAFRQFSIVLGVAMAFVIYKERGIVVRTCGAGLIGAGLVIIGLWGR